MLISQPGSQRFDLLGRQLALVGRHNDPALFNLLANVVLGQAAANLLQIALLSDPALQICSVARQTAGT